MSEGTYNWFLQSLISQRVDHVSKLGIFYTKFRVHVSVNFNNNVYNSRSHLRKN